MGGEKSYENPFQDPNDQDALAAATSEVDGASAYMQAKGYGGDAPLEDMIDQKYVDNALKGNNPPSGQED